MAKKFLDNTGFSYFVSKIKTLLTGKADTNLGNVENSVFAEKATSAGAGVPNRDSKHKWWIHSQRPRRDCVKIWHDDCHSSQNSKRVFCPNIEYQ